MTLSDLTSKTPEELNRMLAELLGWSDFKYEQIWAEHPNDRYDAWTARQPDMIGACACEIPDYCGSYDVAMPEIAKLDLTQLAALYKHLRAMDDRSPYEAYGYSTQQLTIALILTLTSQH